MYNVFIKRSSLEGKFLDVLKCKTVRRMDVALPPPATPFSKQEKVKWVKLILTLESIRKTYSTCRKKQTYL